MDEARPVDDAAVRAAFETARRDADAELARNNPGQAAQVYLDLLSRIPREHPLALEALFHRAQLLEQAGYPDVAIPIFVELARVRHDGAWKALDRMLDASWAAAREAPLGPAGRPAREVLRRLVDRLGAP